MTYASGKYAIAISDRSGLQFPYTEMVKEWTGAWVHTSEYEPKAPQLMPHEHHPDPQALKRPRPARIAPAALISLPVNPFETYAAASQVVNVHSPSHGRSTGDTIRFRGPPTVSPGTGTITNPVAGFSDCPEVDGITGAILCAAAGYTITTGKYVSGSSDDSEDWYYFSTGSSTATTGGISGGGYPVSAGPVTISA